MSANIITRIALYLTLGALLDAFGWTMGTAQFWCMIGITIAADLLGRWDGQRQGAIEGVAMYLKLSESEQSEIRKMVKQWEQR